MVGIWVCSCFVTNVSPLVHRLCSLSDLCNFAGIEYESENESDNWQTATRRSASLSSDMSAFSYVSVMPAEELDRLLDDVKSLGDSNLQVTSSSIQDICCVYFIAAKQKSADNLPHRKFSMSHTRIVLFWTYSLSLLIRCRSVYQCHSPMLRPLFLFLNLHLCFLLLSYPFHRTTMMFKWWFSTRRWEWAWASVWQEEWTRTSQSL